MNKRSIRKKLERKDKYRNIFNEIYEQSPDRRTCFRLRPKYDYVNPYRLQSVRVDGVVDGRSSVVSRRDYAFVCLIKDRTRRYANRLIPYYVSKEYNVISGQTSQRIAGRFVFKQPPANIQLVLLAEEPATVHENPDDNIELQYLQRRRNHDPGKIGKRYTYSIL
jgi:hypothetical protein